MGFLDRLAALLGRRPAPAVQCCPNLKAIICVCVCREDTDAGVAGLDVSLTGPTPGNAQTDGSGIAEFQDRAPGPYSYNVSFPQPKFKDWHVAAYGKDVTAVGGQVAIRDVLAYPFGHLVVEVRDELKDNALIPHAASITATGAAQTLQKDAKGSHTFTPAKCGQYQITAGVPSDFYEHSSYSAKPVVVAEGKTVRAQVLVKGKHVAPQIELDEERLVIVRHDYYDKIKPAVHAHRIQVTLKASAAYDGIGELTCATAADIKVYDKKDSKTALALPLVVKKGELGGRIVWVEGVKPSSGLGKTELKFELKNGSVPVKAAVTEKITCVKLKLEIYKSRPEGGGDPALIADADKIDPGRYVLEQGADDKHLFAERALLVVKKAEPSDFTGNLVLVAVTPGVEVFEKEIPAAGQAELTGGSLTFGNAGIDTAKGKRFWVQGKTLSKGLLDTGWKLGVDKVQDAGAIVDGDRVQMTVLQAELELHKSRTALPAAGKPKKFSDADEIDVGRPLHKQDANFHHGRAMLVVKKVKPDGFTGKLTLAGWHVKHTPSYSEAKAATPRVKLFDDEVAAAGQAAHAFVYEIDHPATYPADGKVLWVEGGDKSGELRDTQIRLGVKEIDKGCDRVAFTVVQFKNLKADVPSTPANTVRLGNSPVPRHAFNPPASKEFDEDYAVNTPLVLIEDSVIAADAVNLSVEIEPAVAKDLVSWGHYRDKSTTGDHGNVIAIHGKDDLDLVQDGADRLKATLRANNVGSFRICPFVDCNGNNKLEPYDASGKKRIDREPYMLMNMLLVRARGHTNVSVAQPANAMASVTDAAGVGVPSSANGVGVSTGDFVNGTNDAVHNKATITVIGGGSDGRRGLDMLFAGWVNNELTVATSTVTGEDVVATYQQTFPPPLPPAPPIPPVNHSRISIWRPPGGLALFLPGPGPAPVILAGPVLDTTPFPNFGTGGNTCVGTEGAVGPPIPIVKTNLAAGQRWTVEMWDSPGDSAPAVHGGFPGTLVAYRFNLDFRSDLVFWTSTTKAPGPSATDPANRLYSTVQTNTWRIRLAMAFNPITGAVVGAVPANANVTLTKDANSTRRAAAVQGSNLETRAPISLRLLAIDARA
jgi:hypothetical protein